MNIFKVQNIDYQRPSFVPSTILSAVNSKLIKDLNIRLETLKLV
jgi:hypothetical protein